MDILERFKKEPELTPAQYWEAQASMWHQNYKGAMKQNAELLEALKDTAQFLDYIGEQRVARKLDRMIAKAKGGK